MKHIHTNVIRLFNRYIMRRTMFEQLLAKYATEATKIFGAPCHFTITPDKLEAATQGKWREADPDSDPAKSAYIIDMGIYLAIKEGISGQSKIATCRLTQLPGCCGVLVSNGAYSFRQKRGLGTLMARLRLDIAKSFGYTTLLCTDIQDNVPQRKILAKLGYNDLFSFVNRRTNNKVAISAINLTEPTPTTNIRP